jgi:hypothetical protein
MLADTQLQVGKHLIQVVLQHVVAHSIAILMFSIVGAVLLQTIVSEVHIVVIIV